MAIPKILLAGGGERAQYMTHNANDTTIRFVLNYPGPVDPDILRAAAKAVLESVDILHSSYFIDGTSAFWRVQTEVEEEQYFQYVRTDGDPGVTAASLSLLPVHFKESAQLRCVLVQSDSASSIVFSVSHLCVDGGDGKYLLGKLVEAYNLLLSTGSADALEVKNGSRAPEQVYEGLGWQEMKELMKVPDSAKVTSLYPYPTQEPGMRRVVSVVIPREVMSAARKKAKGVNASANDLLLAACYQAYGNLPEIQPGTQVSVSSMMDLRRHCKDGTSEGLCNMSGAMPTALTEGVPETFEETLAQVARQTNAIKGDPLAGLTMLPILHGVARGVPVWLQMLVIGKAYSAMPVGLTNLGNLDCQSLALGELVPTGGLFGGPLKKKPGMQVSIASFDGECVLSVYGCYTKEDGEHLLGTLEDMAGQITRYAGQA